MLHSSSMTLHVLGPTATGVRAVLCVVGLTGVAFAQPRNDSTPTPSIRAVANATVTAKPDRVEIDIGVTTQAPTSREAATRNAQQLNHVLKALESALGTNAAIETINYSL